MLVTELQPLNCKQKSFYGKARICNIGNDVMLWSYDTMACSISTNKPTGNNVIQLTGLYSATTTRHIREFLHQFQDLFSARYPDLAKSGYKAKDLKKIIEKQTKKGKR